jgi:ribosomal protein L40E
MLGFLQGLRREFKLRKRRATVIVCALCEVDSPKEAQACSNCGSEHFITPDEQAARLAGQRLRNRAIRRIKELKNILFCEKCGREFPPRATVCERCRKPVGPMSDGMAYQRVKEEFPHVVEGWKAYVSCRDAEPEETDAGGSFHQLFRRAERGSETRRA